MPDPTFLASPLTVLRVERNAPHELAGLLSELDRHVRSARPDRVFAGFLSYEAGVYLEGSIHLFRPPERTPLAWFGLFDLSCSRPHDERGFSSGGASVGTASTLEETAYATAVQKIRDGIARGSVYQVNLTRRVTSSVPVLSGRLAESLYHENPVPLALHLAAEDFAIVSNSPELFFQCDLTAGMAESRPIKGTIARSTDPAADANAVQTLRNSEKDLAEHLMIVDLVRNDLGKVARTGGVSVPHLEIVKSFRHLHHLESTVAAHLLPTATLSDLFLALFPGGSITGAPKRAALSFIHELEPIARGPYTGAAGIVRGDGTAVFNIPIRTAVLSGAGVDYHAGGGIVWDSDPEAEWEETQVKSREFVRVTRALSDEGEVP